MGNSTGPLKRTARALDHGAFKLLSVEFMTYRHVIAAGSPHLILACVSMYAGQPRNVTGVIIHPPFAAKALAVRHLATASTH
jgi:hypothetical protein